MYVPMSKSAAHDKSFRRYIPNFMEITKFAEEWKKFIKKFSNRFHHFISYIPKCNSSFFEHLTKSNPNYPKLPHTASLPAASI